MGSTHSFRLQRRGAVFFYRRRIPLDLRDTLGRSEIVRSLKTERTSEARKRAAMLDSEVYALFDRVRARTRKVAEEKLIERLTGAYFEKLISEDRAFRRAHDGDADAESSGLSYMLEDESEWFDRRRFDHVREDAQELLAAEGIELNGQELEGLHWELARVRLQALRQMMEERDGDSRGLPRAPLYPPTAPAGSKPAKPTRPLSEVIRLYVEDHEGKRWAVRTAAMTKTGLSQFLEIVGDRPAGTVTKDHIDEYMRTLEKLPAHLGTRYPGKTVAEVLATNPEPGLSPETVRKLFAYVFSLFRYAKRKGWVETNPAEDMRPRKAHVAAHEERDALDPSDLRKVFGGDYRARTLEKGRADRFWIPLLMLHTGARLEEIAQLETADVVELDGVWALRITTASEEEDGDKRLKSAQSERVVPLHSDLLALGFLAYVEDMRAKGARRLWPRLEKGEKSQRYGDAVSKWFTRWKRDHGITSNKKVLYSTRHTFTTALKYADVQEFTIAEIVGHKVEGMTVGRYGKKLDLPRLREAVEKASFREPLAELFG